MLAIIIPILFVIMILKKFNVLGQREGKERFNALILKIDKAGKWRVANVAYFFGRRLLTAILLTLPITTEFIFLQYVFILLSSHLYILYLVAVKPYQIPLMNTFALMNEIFYSALIILVFIFSDATPQLTIKLIAGYCLHAAIFLLVIVNLAFIFILMKIGRLRLKDKIEEEKLKRKDKEEY